MQPMNAQDQTQDRIGDNGSQAAYEHASALLISLRNMDRQQKSREISGYIDVVEKLAWKLRRADAVPFPAPIPPEAWKMFGRRLREKRLAAGLTRVQLAQKAKCSDASIKFIESARNVPTRRILSQLVKVTELRLSWSDVPGSAEVVIDQPVAEVEAPAVVSSELNCFLAEDPLEMVIELGRFLQGAGGHVEQTSAYLDHQSAAAYMAMCQQSPVAATIRAVMPLHEMADDIARRSGAGLRVMALGAGDGQLEVRLVQHLTGRPPVQRIELDLLDISQPLLSAAYKHAVEVLGANATVTAMQCNFHNLPTYRLHPEGHRRLPALYCLLGGTMANLDNEPRFFTHSLIGTELGDMLLVDYQVARANPEDPEAIKALDKSWARGVSQAHADWLGGPIWRHSKDIVDVSFRWNLETNCPMPGSYALDAIANVQQKNRPDRQFSMFRFRRYDPSSVTHCLQQLGWELVRSRVYGPEDYAALQLFVKKKSCT